jgi:2-polyprenyl-3-methyl-5-hydroxy-6-metoxy-1,4-benzoquinol methylase
MMDFKKLNQIAANAKNLIAVSNDLQKIAESVEAYHSSRIDELSFRIKAMEKKIDELHKQLCLYGLPKIDEYEQTFESLRSLINSDEWPQAIDIASMPDPISKASQILTLIVTEDFRDMKFLDFGCGEGYVAEQAVEMGTKLSVGYDIKRESRWVDRPGLSFYDNFQEMKKRAPYDIILLFDVIDHLAGVDPLEFFPQLKSLISAKGKIYLRCHPWCSRHGTHLFTSINKAFLHLILNDKELLRLGNYDNGQIFPITHPPITYKYWFKEAGFNIENEIIVRKPVEKFFLENPTIFGKILHHWNEQESICLENIDIVHIDYILTAPSNQQIF